MQGISPTAGSRSPGKIYNTLSINVTEILAQSNLTEQKKTSAITKLIGAEYENYKRVGKIAFISNACKDYGLSEDQKKEVKEKFEAAKSQFRKSVSGESSLSLLVGFIIQNSKTPPSPSPRFDANISATELAARQSQLMTPVSPATSRDIFDSPTLHNLSLSSRTQVSSINSWESISSEDSSGPSKDPGSPATTVTSSSVDSSRNTVDPGGPIRKIPFPRCETLWTLEIDGSGHGFGLSTSNEENSRLTDAISRSRDGSVEHVGVPRSTPLSLTRSTAEIDGSGHGFGLSTSNEENSRPADLETGEIPEIIEGILSEIFSGKELKFFQNSNPVPPSPNTSLINSWASSSSGDGSDSISDLADPPHAGDQEIEDTLAYMLTILEAEHNPALGMISSNRLRSDGSGLSTSNEENSRLTDAISRSRYVLVEHDVFATDELPTQHDSQVDANTVGALGLRLDHAQNSKNISEPRLDDAQTSASQLSVQQSELFSPSIQITNEELYQFLKFRILAPFTLLFLYLLINWGGTPEL